MKQLQSLRFVLAALALAVPLAAQSVSVTSANPNSAAQGAINLNVAISGKGFKNGANSKFFVTGTTNPGGVVINSTAFVNSTQLTANITVDSTAVVSGFDIEVDNPDGHSGKGTDTFSVTANSANAAKTCTPGSLPSNIALVATFNSTTGTPVYTNGIGKTVRGRLTTVMGRPVILAAAGGTGGSVVDVFFLDRASGAVLDGTFGQPHLTLTTPQPSFYSMVIDDVNGDGIPDLVLGHGTGVAWVHLGQGGGSGALTFSAAIVLTPPQPNSGMGASLAVGNLDGSAYNTIALGLTPTGVGKSFVPGKVFLFKYNGSGGFNNTATITDPQKSSSGFGGAVAIGDVTGDSLPDLVVGAGGSNRAWVYTGTGLSSSFFLTSGASDGFGSSVGVANMIAATTGGYSDLFVVNGFQTATPKALVYGGPVTSSSTASLTLKPVEINWPTSGLDFADIDNDGLADVVFGAEATGCSGSAFVYLSSPSYHSYAIPGPLSNSSPVGYGSAASSVPGTHIVLVGDKWWTGPSGVQSGQVYVYKVN